MKEPLFETKVLSNRLYKVALILSVSLCVRLIYYFLDHPIVGYDAAENIKLAQRLAVGDFAGGISTYWAPLYPFLIAIPSLFTDSNLIPVFVVSIIAGSLAALATYFLAEQSYGGREAVLAALFAVFYPHLLRSTYDFGTPNIYLPLMMLALYLFWRALRAGSDRFFFLTGATLGLSYLTRPEALGYLIFFIPWLAFDKIIARQKIIFKSFLKHSFIILFGFALLATPYLIYLRQATGKWTISGKFERHVVGDEYFSDRKRLYENSTKSEHYIYETGKIFVRLTLFNLMNIHKKLPYLIPPFLFLLIGLGLFRASWTIDQFRRELYLFAFCAATVLCYAITVNEIPYFYVLLPIFFTWMAKGMVEAERWRRESLKSSSANRVFNSKIPVFSIVLFVACNIYTLPLNNFMRSREAAWEFSTYEQMNGGLWLRQYVQPDSRIMSVDFRPAFYAQGTHVSMTANNFDDLLNDVISQQADFIVIDERNLKNKPQLLGLLNESKNLPGLERIYFDSENATYKLAIYRVLK